LPASADAGAPARRARGVGQSFNLDASSSSTAITRREIRPQREAQSSRADEMRDLVKDVLAGILAKLILRKFVNRSARLHTCTDPLV